MWSRMAGLFLFSSLYLLIAACAGSSNGPGTTFHFAKNSGTPAPKPVTGASFGAKPDGKIDDDTFLLLQELDFEKEALAFDVNAGDLESQLAKQVGLDGKGCANVIQQKGNKDFRLILTHCVVPTRNDDPNYYYLVSTTDQSFCYNDPSKSCNAPADAGSFDLLITGDFNISVQAKKGAQKRFNVGTIKETLIVKFNSAASKGKNKGYIVRSIVTSTPSSPTPTKMMRTGNTAHALAADSTSSSSMANAQSAMPQNSQPSALVNVSQSSPTAGRKPAPPATGSSAAVTPAPTSSTKLTGYNLTINSQWAFTFEASSPSPSAVTIQLTDAGADLVITNSSDVKQRELVYMAGKNPLKYVYDATSCALMDQLVEGDLQEQTLKLDSDGSAASVISQSLGFSPKNMSIVQKDSTTSSTDWKLTCQLEAPTQAKSR